jgi:polysaccharide deacetylase family protein (PEP-CTERM system associated)
VVNTAVLPTRVAGPDPSHDLSEDWSAKIILSFDVEEHDRIEAAAGLDVGPELKAHYRDRLTTSTNWVLDALAEARARATFFVVGQISEHNPALIRRMAREGHEVASHSWDHRRVHHFTPASFRADVRRSKEALEDLTGREVVGFRAPTFSVMRETAWALDVLAGLGLTYDSSIYPVYHDRYGVPGAPRGPFLARGCESAILEFPPATLRVLGVNFAMGGGGYFRLFPLFLTEQAIRQSERDCWPSVATLYFHPWEFDPQQRRLPLRFLSRLRTYVGIGRSRGRLCSLLARYRFCTMADVAKRLDRLRGAIPCFSVAEGRVVEQGAA